ncbi:MAG: tRNA (adenosine(37)-N6)-threonylcarbamoyltransferase complex dimerization subunit type 1 TsaB [Ilumatobacteraceae bacterium]
MNVLAIETATDHVSVAIGSAEGLAGSVEVGGGRRHAETLAPAIDWLCRTSGVDLSEVTMIAADVGPGLFTGMRVGLATASTMAVALGVPTFAACSLDLVAFPLRHSQRPVAAVLDARKGELFHALYVPVHGGLQRITEPQVGTLDDVIADLPRHGPRTGPRR